jgi:hypothetical protein
MNPRAVIQPQGAWLVHHRPHLRRPALFAPMLPENIKLNKLQAQGPDYRLQGFPERKNFGLRLAANGIMQGLTFFAECFKKKGLFGSPFYNEKLYC